MLKELLQPEIIELIEHKRWNELKEAVSDWPAVEIVDLLIHIHESQRVLLFRLLPRELSAEVFSHLEYEDQDILLLELTNKETKELLIDLSPDDRTDLFEEMPAQATLRLMNMLPQEELKEAKKLLGYPEDSIGRAMTPDFVAVRPDWTIRKTLEHIRKFGKDSETIYRIYVTNSNGLLIDDILLRNIIIANPDDTIETLMDNQVVSLSAFDDQEETVNVLKKYDLFAVPVVDSNGILVGIVTFDDVLDISEEEATEDFQKIGGMNPVEQTYFHASIWTLWSKRIPWLTVLLTMGFFTAGLLDYFENILTQVVTLSFFLPMILGTAGNTGTQSSTMVIRALALDEMSFSDWWKVLLKNLTVGLLMGVFLGFITYLSQFFYNDISNTVIFVVSLSIVVLVIWSNIVGALLPLLLSKLKLDPAVISNPFISTISDISGIIIYLQIAQLFFEL
jgi:magnesium transporter